MNILLPLGCVGLLGLVGAIGCSSETAETEPSTEATSYITGEQGAGGEPSPEGEESMPDRYVLGHKVQTIDGEPADLDQYKGKVVLIVNTASRCGLTPQYAGLEKLYEQHKDGGLVILGFPANNFGNQEPGSNEEIAEFCAARYDITFPMFEKLSVKDEDQHPLYKQLSALSSEPDWNFTKYLIDREGKFVARYGPRVTPDDKAMAARISELLEAAAEG